VGIFDARIRIFDVSARGAAEQTSSIDAIRADLQIDESGVRLAPLEGRVGRAAITGEATADAKSVRLAFESRAIADADLPAMLGLLGAARPAVLRLDRPASASVSVTIDRTTAQLSGRGTIALPALTVEPLRLERIEAQFTVAGTRLTFAPTTFVLEKGTHSGRLTLALDRDPPRWTSDSRIEGLDVGALLDALAGRDAKIDGRGRLDAKVEGRIQPDFVLGLDGQARVALADGVIHDFPLVATVNRALRLAQAEGSDTRFERLAATLALARGVATTEDLRIDAGDLRFEAAGQIGFDGALDLRGRAIVSAERVAEAVASVPAVARAKNSSGEIAIPLTIAGTMDAPRFGLDLATAVREGVRDELMRRLRGFIRK
jgi:AsmA protein